MSETITPATRAARRDPAPARAALAAKFSSPEEKSAHYRALAARSHARRLQLAAEDADALRAAYSLLDRLAKKYEFAPAAVVVVGEGVDHAP